MRTAVRVIAAIALLVVIGALVGYFVWYRPPAPPAVDPRLTYTGPFRNIHPDVAYVPEETCAGCHEKQANTYQHHPMARTLTPIAEAKLPPTDAKRHSPFESLGQRFEITRKKGGVWHERSANDSSGKPLFHHEMPVHFVVGSGAHAHSFLSIDGSTVMQTPITWYAQKQIWDLSPGFAMNALAGRRVGGDCLFCHSNFADEDPPRGETAYRIPIFPRGNGIGCQRCHGPGSKHVADPGNKVKVELDGEQVELDPTIVNPKHLSPHLRESICWQCHLEGDVRVLRRGRGRFDFRPGMPLEDFIGVFTDSAEQHFDDIVNHVEQMLESRCYKESSKPKLGCVSCHDPHEKPAPENSVAFYRHACLKCHGENQCSLPRPERLAKHKDDNCVACHMPPFATANITHVSSTNHRVLRRPVHRMHDRPPGIRMDPVHDLVSFFTSLRDKSDPELDRDRALAGAILTRVGRPMLHPLDEELKEAARRDPADLKVVIQYGLTLVNQKEAAAALPIFKDVLARQPNSEPALLGQAIASGELGKLDDAIESWQQLVKQVPSHDGYRRGLLEATMRAKKVGDAEKYARDWVAFDPGIPDARAMLRDILLEEGKRDEAAEQERVFKELLPR